MPENYDCREDYSKYDSMTTQELEEILRQDVENLEEETDIELMMYITGVIRTRKERNPKRKTPEEAIEIFKIHYMPTDAEAEESDQPGKEEPAETGSKVIFMPRWFRRVVSAAAVVVLLLVGSLTVQAFGPEFLQAVIRWTEETFYFDRGQHPTSGNLISTSPSEDGEREYQSLQEALEAHNITIPLVPTWLPEGYELAEIKVDKRPIYETIAAKYAKSDHIIVVQITHYVNTAPTQMEQSDMLESYLSGDRVYYILEDGEQLRAAWITSDFECYISGEVTIEEIKAMIDSIKE